ncbi:uncharacterized protein LOC124811850 [Hydra vulgaris]|uniref:uncharacterized protein LOC124811850 n=1 Tax=Hydra vulgaris TaxID=6087 RepID=UPI0032EA6BD0
MFIMHYLYIEIQNGRLQNASSTICSLSSLFLNGLSFSKKDNQTTLPSSILTPVLTIALQVEQLSPDLVNCHFGGNDHRKLILLEEIKQNNQTIIFLLQQLSAQQQRGNIETSFDEFGLLVSLMKHLQKLETDCLDNDLRGKLMLFGVILQHVAVRMLGCLCH